MELLPIIRRLWRRRLLLAAGLVLAVATAIKLGGAPTSATTVAWTRAALDTPNSELVASAPTGADTLPWRASLLVHLMATDSIQRELAQRLGVRPAQVAVIDPALDVPVDPTSMAQNDADVALPSGASYLLTLSLTNDQLPLISIEAVAPGRAGANRLAEAAVSVLQSQGPTGGRYQSLIATGGGAPPRLQPFIVQQVAPIRDKPFAASKLSMKQIAAPILILVLWCAIVLRLPSLRRGSRIGRARPHAAA
jgi:hypothetical protein